MHLQAQGSAVSGSVLWIVWDNCNIEARLSKNQYSIDLIMLLHLKAHWICSDAGSSTFFPDNMNKKCIIVNDIDDSFVWNLFAYLYLWPMKNDWKCNFMFQKSGIDMLVPNMKIDDYLFEPCGYSMNGVLLNVMIMIFKTK